MSKIIRLAILLVLLSGLIGVKTDLTTAGSQPEWPSIPDGSSTNYGLDWVVVGEVSGGSTSSAHYQLSATIGQMGAGTSSESENFALCVGFQCALVKNEYQVYLPLAIR